MLNEEKRKIDLHLPTGWNDCTTEELEHIATAILYRTQMQNRYRPFDWMAVKIDVLLAVNGMEVVSTENDSEKNLSFIVRFKRPSLWQRIRARVGRTAVQFHRNKDTDDFELPVDYIQALCERLDWINDEKAAPMVNFPYPTLKLKGKIFEGPAPMMDGYQWNEYRLLQDWMQLYMMQQNHALQVASSRQVTAQLLRQSAADVDFARRHFLATLFHMSDYSEKADYSDMFSEFDPVKFQVILFWWSAFMQQLSKKFPRVFKVQPVKKGQKNQSPWDFYNRVTATLAAKYHASEDQQRNETYSVTLQKLENMAEEAAEMEKIRNKHK